MARINIEECWWSDPRRMKLILKIGIEADSAAVNMWRTAQEFWSRGKRLIPKEVFDKIVHSEILIEAGLAEVRECSVYVRGSSEYLSWVEEQRELGKANGSKGGLASAEARRIKYGSAVPLNASNAEPKPNPPPNDPPNETEANRTVPNPSDSGSSSKNTNTPIVPFQGTVPIQDWFRLAKEKYTKLFPGTKTGPKAFDRFRDQVKTEHDFAVFMDSIDHYQSSLSRPENSWRSAKTTLANYLGTKRSGFFWRDYEFPDNVRKIQSAGDVCGVAEV